MLAVVRMIAGAAFLVAGLLKLLDESLLYGGLMERLEQYGEAFPVYHRLLERFVELHAEFFAYLVGIAEVLVGISLLSGALVSLSSLGGAFLVLNFGLATTYGNPLGIVMHVALIGVLLCLGCAGAGLTWGVDAWLTQHVNEAVVLFPLRRSLPS